MLEANSNLGRAYMQMCLDSLNAAKDGDEQRQLLIGAAADAFEAAYPTVVAAVRRKWNPISP